MALIVVLALITIVSILLVLFVTAAREQRIATFSYSQSNRAEQVGLSALDLVVNEFVNEMGKDAPPYMNGTQTYYTNVGPANILPQAIGTNGNMPSLIRISTNASFTGALKNGTLIASAYSSASSSFNHRSVSAARWGQIYLGSFPSDQSAPYWLFATRGGVTNSAAMIPPGCFVPTSSTAVNNPDAANTNYIIGRFAYAVYDEGSLLDINAAGYPSALGLNQAQLKGTLAGADLTKVGFTSAALADFTAWRDAAVAGSTNSYMSYYTNYATTNSYARVYTTNNIANNLFLSRQDLIRAARLNKAGLTTNVLSNLATFTREWAAPSWEPQTNAAGSVYAYANNAMTTGATNRFLPSITFPAATTITSYHSDGITTYTYTVQPGDSAIQHRFPLDRIAWLALGSDGTPDSRYAAAVRACFGLQWDMNNYLWKYVGSTGSGVTEQARIESLDTVATESREPNFFELLQAGILQGSLGVTGGGSATFPSTLQTSVPFQIFRIGASIIDQYDADSVPTVIEYIDTVAGSACQACGIESLPYLDASKIVSGQSPDQTIPAWAIYSMFRLWNPHQTRGSTGKRPRVRLNMSGTFKWQDSWANPTVRIDTVSGTSSIELTGTGANGVNGFSEPKILTVSDLTDTALVATSTTGWVSTVLSGTSYAAYRFLDLKINTTLSPSNSDDWVDISYYLTNFNYWLEFNAGGNTWIPYSFSSGANIPATRYVPNVQISSRNYSPITIKPGPAPQQPDMPTLQTGFTLGPVFLTSDPRSTRFNLWLFKPSNAAPAPESFVSAPWGPNVNPFYANSGYGGAANTVSFQVPSLFGNSYYPSTLCRNNGSNSGSITAYQDLDGVQRISDSGLFSGVPQTGNPYTRTADRPIILNRPFLSVAEIGYAFRDQPWKTLDFFSQGSADAGLLDLFSVHEQPEIAAGRLSLNTHNAAVLQAVLGGITTDANGSVPLTVSDAIATNLASFTAAPAPQGALVNKSDLVTRFLPSVVSSSDEMLVKSQRESVVRALADVGQTRTWNLLIDLVAQAGKYPPTASNFDQFVVEGEKHYWLHVAIDRFTGKIIDRQLETVGE